MASRHTRLETIWLHGSTPGSLGRAFQEYLRHMFLVPRAACHETECRIWARLPSPAASRLPPAACRDALARQRGGVGPCVTSRNAVRSTSATALPYLPRATPRATDGWNKDDSAHHWEVSVAVWKSHCEAGIGVITPIPYHQNMLFSVARGVCYRRSWNRRYNAYSLSPKYAIFCCTWSMLHMLHIKCKLSMCIWGMHA